MDKKPDYIDFRAAASLLESEPSPTTVWRWARHGVTLPDGSRLTLPYIRSGKRMLTTQQWLTDFLRQWYEAEDATPPQVTNEQPKPLSPSDLNADRELTEAGL